MPKDFKIRFDRTYEELKHLPAQVDGHGPSKGFDRTYEELKLEWTEPIPNGETHTVLIVPMRN